MSAATPLDQSIKAPGVVHSSFRRDGAAKRYDPRAALAASTNYALGYMPDEATQDYGKRMHYALWRMRRADTARDRRKWKAAFLALRDRVVLGNQKLVFKAVRYRRAWTLLTDDLTGEGHVVLINAVERYNPWLGVRFSTYAFTCLVRALVRSTKRRSGQDKRLVLQDQLALEGAAQEKTKDKKDDSPLDLDHYLRDAHPLLTEREKAVLRMRFGIGPAVEPLKLELIGERLGLSKERIRQVQVSALGKLRVAACEAGLVAV
jgi:RNA polymerase sigma factor (sigma-70 family)